MTESPCKNACRLNANDICITCGRSRDEVASWTTLSVAERQQVNELAKIRLKTIVERKK